MSSHDSVFKVVLYYQERCLEKTAYSADKSHFSYGRAQALKWVCTYYICIIFIIYYTVL